MNNVVLSVMIAMVCLSSAEGSAQAPVPSAPSPLTYGDRFRLYLRQTYSFLSILIRRLPVATKNLTSLNRSRELTQTRSCVETRTGALSPIEILTHY
jgi:hypothetical protein